MNWYSKLTTALGAIAGVLGVLASPDALAILPASVAVPLALAGVVIASLSRGLAAWNTPNGR